MQPPPKRRQQNHGFKKGQGRQRSSHMGYDCYAAGSVDSDGKIRCVLRRHRLPSGVDDMQKDHLPDEMIWPYRDHALAHDLIDAVLEMDVRTMLSWKRQYPDHHFGFEKYLPWAESFLVGNGEKEKPDLLSLPRSKAIQRDVILVKDIHLSRPVTLTLALLRYDDGDSWGEVSFSHGKTLLTRALLELRTNVASMVDHFPGRWKGLGIDHRVLRGILGKVRLDHLDSKITTRTSPYVVLDPAAAAAD